MCQSEAGQGSAVATWAQRQPADAGPACPPLPTGYLPFLTHNRQCLVLLLYDVTSLWFFLQEVGSIIGKVITE